MRQSSWQGQRDYSISLSLSLSRSLSRSLSLSLALSRSHKHTHTHTHILSQLCCMLHNFSVDICYPSTRPLSLGSLTSSAGGSWGGAWAHLYITRYSQRYVSRLLNQNSSSFLAPLQTPRGDSCIDWTIIVVLISSFKSQREKEMEIIGSKAGGWNSNWKLILQQNTIHLVSEDGVQRLVLGISNRWPSLMMAVACS